MMEAAVQLLVVATVLVFVAWRIQTDGAGILARRILSYRTLVIWICVAGLLTLLFAALGR